MPVDNQLLVAALIGAGIGLLVGALVATVFALRRIGQLRGEEAALRSALRSQEQLDHERDTALEIARERLTASFKMLAGESLQSNSKNFLSLARENLGRYQTQAKAEMSEREQAINNLVKPINEALRKTEQQITDIEKDRRQAYGHISAHLQNMHVSQKALQSETQKLVGALKRPEVRGQWGEITLRRLTELAGMVENCDFYEQEHRPTEDGAIRPDMVIRLPDQRELVVDVKTPLDAYLAATEATDPATRKTELARHARRVRDRIQQLSAKAYWTQFKHSPEFVILFIPGDQFLSAALDEDPTLLDEALRQKVILATPTSFVALLKAVAYGWRQLALAKSAEEIRDKAEELYKRLATFTAHMAAIGKHLGSSVEAFNRAVGSLESQVLPGARKFTEMGIVPRRPLETLTPLEKAAREVTARPEAVESDLAGETDAETTPQSAEADQRRRPNTEITSEATEHDDETAVSKDD